MLITNMLTVTAILSSIKLYRATQQKQKDTALFVSLTALLSCIAYNLDTNSVFYVGDNQIQVFFTKHDRCTSQIVELIDQAQESIFIQSYGWSSTRITDAIVNAAHRGVQVRMLTDKSSMHNKSQSHLTDLILSNVDVSIDYIKSPGIAHNKIIILDNNTVITGSFNFTKNAEANNAENVVVIQHKDIAQTYIDNWHRRFKKSISYADYKQKYQLVYV